MYKFFHENDAPKEELENLSREIEDKVSELLRGKECSKVEVRAISDYLMGAVSLVCNCELAGWN